MEFFSDDKESGLPTKETTRSNKHTSADQTVRQQKYECRYGNAKFETAFSITSTHSPHEAVRGYKLFCVHLITSPILETAEAVFQCHAETGP